VLPAGDPGFDELLARCDFAQPQVPQARRAIVRVELDRISDSCGYGVPLMRYEGVRPHQDAWASKQVRVGGEDALIAYQREKNARSIDGLPALDYL
jgi:hypothetical protein